MPITLVRPLHDVVEQPNNIHKQEIIELGTLRVRQWDGESVLRIRAQAIWGSNGETEKTQQNRYDNTSAGETPPARKGAEPA